MLKKDDSLLYPGQPADFEYLDEAKTYIEIYTLWINFLENDISEAFNRGTSSDSSFAFDDVFMNKQLSAGLKNFHFKWQKNDVLYIGLNEMSEDALKEFDFKNKIEFLNEDTNESIIEDDLIKSNLDTINILTTIDRINHSSKFDYADRLIIGPDAINQFKK